MHPALEDLNEMLLHSEDTQPAVLRTWFKKWFENLDAVSYLDKSLMTIIQDPTGFRVKNDQATLEAMVKEVVYIGPEQKVVRFRDLGVRLLTSEEGRGYPAYATEISLTFLKHRP